MDRSSEVDIAGDGMCGVDWYVVTTSACAPLDSSEDRMAYSPILLVAIAVE